MEIPSLGDQYNLKWNNHLANFAQTFIDHQNGESLVDVTLSCEGQYIKAHKLILSACSDYFHSIFQVHETLQHPIILLNGVRFIDLKYILHFMYHGEVKVVDNDLPNVLALGETLHIKGLSSVKLRNKHSEESSFPTIGASKKSNKDFSQNEAQFSTQYIPPPLCHVSSDVNGKKLAPDKVNESLINKPEVQAKTLEKAIINKIPISESQAVLNNARKTSTNNGNQSPDSRNPSTKMTRAPHAFMIFAKEWRKKLTIEHPEENNKEISVRLGNMWKNLLPETRNIYYKAARMAEEEQKNKCSEFVSETKKRKAAHDPINSVVSDKNTTEKSLLGFPLPFTRSNEAHLREKNTSPAPSSSTISSIKSDYEEEESTGSSELAYIQEVKTDNTVKNHVKNIHENSRFFLGLPQEVYFLVSLLESKANVYHNHVLIVLKKIRLNDPYFRLALDFGISKAQISRIINKCLPLLAAYMKQLIFWPDAHKIRKNLPIPFRYRYNKVQSIIDCLEIEIEKPTKALHQALTWSNYKKANTLKYLISSTPDGLINFISEGFGGRITDKEIIEASTFLNILPNNCEVMADRGFKAIGSLLQKKGCNLIRPPSVETGSLSSKEDVKQSKRIASLRIHIERVIRRLREFAILEGHSCIDHQLVPKTDYLIIIACGIVNLQGPLIK